MKNLKHEIMVLNQILKLLHQTIALYDIYIMKAKNDESVKSVLQKIQKQHHEQVGHMIDLVQELEGNPINSAGLNLGIKEFKVKVSLSSNTKKILDQAMQDEEVIIQTIEQAKSDVSENVKIQLKDFTRELKAIVKRLYQTKQETTIKRHH